MERKEELWFMNNFEILRLDHRTFRDQRITTHVALTSRTLGAIKFSYSGDKDSGMEQSILDVAERWGGKFEVSHETSISKYIKSFDGIVAHLTMYGEKHPAAISIIKEQKEDVLIIIGGTKVPRYVYELSDFNIAIGWQPHSEVAAVAIFLYDIVDHKILYEDRSDSKVTITKNGSKSKRSLRFSNL